MKVKITSDIEQAKYRLKSMIEGSKRGMPQKLEAAGREVVKLAKQLAPHDTGAMEDSLGHTPAKAIGNGHALEITVDTSRIRHKNETVGDYFETIHEGYADVVAKPGPRTMAKAKALGTRAGGDIQNPSRSVSRAVTEWFLPRAINILRPTIKAAFEKAIRK